jgi:hypothetical protein
MATANPTTPLLTNRAYDLLKFLAQILLPAVGAMYFGLAAIWGLPNAEEVVGTITVVDTFLGVLLGLSTKAYNNSDAKYDGTAEIEVMDDRKVVTMSLKDETVPVENRDEILFRVKNS